MIIIYDFLRQFEEHCNRNSYFVHELWRSVGPDLSRLLINNNEAFLNRSNIRSKTNKEIIGYLYRFAIGSSPLEQLYAEMVIAVKYFYSTNRPLKCSMADVKPWMNQAISYVQFFQEYYELIMEYKSSFVHPTPKGKIMVADSGTTSCWQDLFYDGFPIKSLGEAIKNGFSNRPDASKLKSMAEIFQEAIDAITRDRNFLQEVRFAGSAITTSLQASPQAPRHPTSAQRSAHVASQSARPNSSGRTTFFQPRPSSTSRYTSGRQLPTPRISNTSLSNLSDPRHSVVGLYTTPDGAIRDEQDDYDDEEDNDLDDSETFEDDAHAALNALARGTQEHSEARPCFQMIFNDKCEKGDACRYSHDRKVLQDGTREYLEKLKKSQFFKLNKLTAFAPSSDDP
jgi:hypothetical protein